MLSKPLGEIGVADIQSLIDSEVPEGDRIEFKRELPGEKGTPDPWATGENKVSNYAKDTILKEVIAFANAYGGVLLIGIEESGEKPAVAAKISPIRRCAELAERLKLIFRDRVEPQLTRLDIVAKPIEQDGSGVVMIRVGRSRMAPHRVTKTRICPIRRADRCEEMTMREIQDMTLNVSRGMERLEKRLEERSKLFEGEFDCLETPKDAFGIRFTAVPVSDDVRIDRVFQNNGFIKEYDKPRISIVRISETDGEIILRGVEGTHLSPSDWRPRLRASRAEDGRGKSYDSPRARNTYREVHCDGTIELGFVSVRRVHADERSHDLDLDPDLPIAMLGTLAAWADHLRKQVQAPAVEYALEVEIRVLGGDVSVNYGTRDPIGPSGTLQPEPVKFHKYSLDDPSEIPTMLLSFYRDFWNSMRRDVPDEKSAFMIKIA